MRSIVDQVLTLFKTIPMLYKRFQSIYDDINNSLTKTIANLHEYYDNSVRWNKKLSLEKELYELELKVQSSKSAKLVKNPALNNTLPALLSKGTS